MTPAGTDTQNGAETAVRRIHPARRAGEIAQGIVLGIWLPVAIVELIKLAGDISPFKYQGF